jgi:hypothetical protein
MILPVPTFEQLASSIGHRDASMHIGGHGEPWPDIKAMVITLNGQTYNCARCEGAETVTPVGSVRQGLEMFAVQLQAAFMVLPA